MSAITKQQFLVVVIAPMVTGSLSVLGSTIITFMIFRSNEKLSSTYHRILFGMSFMDIISSVAYLLVTIPFPKDIPLLWSHSYGNTITCNIQGMMIFTGNVGCNMYNCSLAIFYMLKLAHAVKEEQMRKRFEPFFHILPLLYLTSMNIFLLIKQSFNPLYTVCMIASYPKGCNLNPDLPCTRGEDAVEYFWTFHAGPIIFIFFVIMFSMAKIYYAVRSQEIKMRRYQISIQLRNIPVSQGNTNEIPAPSTLRGKVLTKLCPSSSSKNPQKRELRMTPLAKKRRETMIQCSCYVFAYFICIIFPLVFHILIKAGKVSYPIWVLVQLFTPLQGRFKFLVFIRPRVISYREADPGLSYGKAFVKAILFRSERTTGAFRRRSSIFNNPQGNGGRRYTAREFHLREVIDAMDEVSLSDESMVDGTNDGNQPCDS